MKKYKKNVPITVTFGGDPRYNEGTKGTMIPLAINSNFKFRNAHVITFGYCTDNRTIDLVIDDNEIDFNTFQERE